VDRAERKLTQNVSLMAIFPIGGMMGGLVLSYLWARHRIPDEIQRLAHIVRWGVLGFFLGLALAVLMLLHGRGTISVRALMGLVVIAAVLCWWMVAILFGALGY
jgi:hypothetical protein